MQLAIDAIFSGIGFGFILSLLLGPVFFFLLNTSIRYGFKSGAMLALGIMLNDATYFMLAFIGLSQFSESQVFRIGLALVGGAFLIGYGFYLMFRKELPVVEDKPTNLTMLGYVGKGFLVNGLNPFILLYWVGVVGTVSVEFDFERNLILLFFAGCMITIFSMDLLKVYLSGKLKNMIKLNLMKWISRVAGIFLIGFGVWLIFGAWNGSLQLN